ncbi:hypothetical protein [Sinorhizobium meliloti]|uniref:hypothetical protein n=1 Tax=Rhizobium meliloti TaxID=382 RepID=UPI00238024DB|nr:hypothetical protein [Sinorhizobium meliloti]MDE3818760.1 hypothetical protein [Sinorhizobium meliloti]MDW9613094.1 hypothetical protein [Sinorhizobium meliloti]
MKVHKVGGTWRRADKWLMGNKKKGRGVSYRALWEAEGSPYPFEAWLREKGLVIPK